MAILNYSLHHISAKITLVSSDFTWKFTGFYDHPDRIHRVESWQLLFHLSILNHLDWLVVGDFNEITNNAEKVGGATRTESHMASFRSTLDDCLLGDLGYWGSRFTKNNRRDCVDFVKDRLDSALTKDGATCSRMLQWKYLLLEHRITTLCESGSFLTLRHIGGQGCSDSRLDGT